MNDSIDQKFEEVEAAVEQAVANFASEIENMLGTLTPLLGRRGRRGRTQTEEGGLELEASWSFHLRLKRTV